MELYNSYHNGYGYVARRDVAFNGVVRTTGVVRAHYERVPGTNVFRFANSNYAGSPAALGSMSIQVYRRAVGR
jgi:hypothetical protein